MRPRCFNNPLKQFVYADGNIPHKNRTTPVEPLDTGHRTRVRTLHLCPPVQGSSREVLPLFRPLVLALQVQAQKQPHRVWRGLAAAGRICEDCRHDRRVDGPRADETAPQTVGVPLETGLAETAHHGGRRGLQLHPGHLHLLDDCLYVGHHLHPVQKCLRRHGVLPVGQRDRIPRRRHTLDGRRGRARIHVERDPAANRRGQTGTGTARQRHGDDCHTQGLHAAPYRQGGAVCHVPHSAGRL